MKIIESPDYHAFEEALAPLWAAQNASAGVSFIKRRWAFTLENDDQELIGGIGGHMKLDWMYIQHLIVDPKERGKGHGRELLARAERMAREFGLTGMYLTTMTSQVPGFYQKAGFEEVGRIPDMPRGAGTITFAKKFR